jgi:hypothetical protein
VPDLARLLQRFRIDALSLPPRERAQRRACDIGAEGQELQRADQRVAAEQRVEPSRIAGAERQARRV